VVLGFRPRNATGYGRLVVEGEDCRHPRELDASPAERAIRLQWRSVDGVSVMRPAIPQRIGNDNRKGEYYLLYIAIARSMGRSGRHRDRGGRRARINTTHARGNQAALRQRLRRAAMGGAPWSHERFFVGGHHVRPRRGGGAVRGFGGGVPLRTTLIRSFSHLDRAHVGKGAVVGPYARLRPGACLQDDVHIGNFVEIKEALIETGAKANHLSYIGDATVGAGANVGAGTITCNYDGTAKHRTEIGKNAFIGSNSALVAPVKIGEGAYIGSGSVITRDVPADALAIGRGQQVVKEGWARRLRDLKSANKKRTPAT
jgi:bifunctional UDP-N-acetylglucosamine pyrophosphorylase/glucosamine-1-phosphate N-acetyltransferase